MTTNYLKEMQTSSSLSDANATYIEQLYENYLHDQNSVTPEWQKYFVQNYAGGTPEVSHADIREHFLALGEQRANTVVVSGEAILEKKQQAVTELISSYRTLGNRRAKTDPLNLQQLPDVPELTLGYHGLTDADLAIEFDASSLAGLQRATLKSIFELLQKTYGGSLGVEFMHITDTQQRTWLLQRFESIKGEPQFSVQEKRRILEKLIASEGLEKYLGTKYVGQKRFSIEGCDNLIPMMDVLTSHAAKNGVKEIVVGMAHRGRLNMLVNFLGKPPADLFNEFEGKVKLERSGDVKYHKGFSSTVSTPYGAIHLATAYNPSHLEIIDPVIEGSVYAKQWRRGDAEKQQVLPVLTHGDAAFSSQGVVQETFNLSQVPGYATGGTVHLVINNQVGFTTSAKDGRSTYYCTDIAKMVEAPIVHVNGDDAEACAYAIQLLYDFRKQFNKDVVIDLVCYRRHGHQEVDEPFGTQPVMYNVIKNHAAPYEIYSQKLQAAGVVTAQDVTEMAKKYRETLDKGESVHINDTAMKRGETHEYRVNWHDYTETNWRANYSAQVDLTQLKKLGEQIATVPANFQLQAQVAKIVDARHKMATGETPIDWGFAENLAYATLLTNGIPVRISGEDVQRGTFAHRHAVLNEQTTGAKYAALQKLSTDQAPFFIYNSILSEVGVMGFENGYAAAAPDTLVIWEAQFGDFGNGAQVIIDQFLSSGEQKWGQRSGLVLLLPHGYEGAGPEHSSARLERYLQLCAQDNMQVVVPTTPAQIYHLLRRQMLRTMRFPLIVMTPKSLLRSPLATSTLAELAKGKFEVVIGEVDKTIDAATVERVILCTGKVYYDLATQRREQKLTNVAIIRIEQLYPFPDKELHVELQKYKNAQTIVWCQEEPRNQGSWHVIQEFINKVLSAKQTLVCASRPAAAAPACGYMATHVAEQKEVVRVAFI